MSQKRKLLTLSLSLAGALTPLAVIASCANDAPVNKIQGSKTQIKPNLTAETLGLSKDADQARSTISANWIFQNKEKLFSGTTSQIQSKDQLTIQTVQANDAKTQLNVSVAFQPGTIFIANNHLNEKNHYVLLEINGFQPSAEEALKQKLAQEVERINALQLKLKQSVLSAEQAAQLNSANVIALIANLNSQADFTYEAQNLNLNANQSQSTQNLIMSFQIRVKKQTLAASSKLQTFAYQISNSNQPPQPEKHQYQIKLKPARVFDVANQISINSINVNTVKEILVANVSNFFSIEGNLVPNFDWNANLQIIHFTLLADSGAVVFQVQLANANERGQVLVMDGSDCFVFKGFTTSKPEPTPPAEPPKPPSDPTNPYPGANFAISLKPNLAPIDLKQTVGWDEFDNLAQDVLAGLFNTMTNDIFDITGSLPFDFIWADEVMVLEVDQSDPQKRLVEVMFMIQNGTSGGEVLQESIQLTNLASNNVAKPPSGSTTTIAGVTQAFISDLKAFDQNLKLQDDNFKFDKNASFNQLKISSSIWDPHSVLSHLNKSIGDLNQKYNNKESFWLSAKITDGKIDYFKQEVTWKWQIVKPDGLNEQVLWTANHNTTVPFKANSKRIGQLDGQPTPSEVEINGLSLKGKLEIMQLFDAERPLEEQKQIMQAVNNNWQLKALEYLMALRFTFWQTFGDNATAIDYGIEGTPTGQDSAITLVLKAKIKQNAYYDPYIQMIEATPNDNIGKIQFKTNQILEIKMRIHNFQRNIDTAISGSQAFPGLDQGFSLSQGGDVEHILAPANRRLDLFYTVGSTLDFTMTLDQQQVINARNTLYKFVEFTYFNTAEWSPLWGPTTRGK